MDEMWSFYHDKKHQIWLWWAVEHETNIPLAYTFGTREHKYLDKLLDLLKPFPIRTVYADNNFAYENKIKDKVLIRGKKNTQKIERNHLTLRTRLKRLARKTICFSKDKDIQRINYTATSPQVSHLIKQNKKCVVTCFRNNALS